MGELPFIPPKEVSRQEMLETVPGHVCDSPLFLEAIDIAVKAHEFKKRESGYPVLEGHIFQSVYILAKLSEMLRIRLPVFVYAAQLLHDSLEDTAPGAMPRRKRVEARALQREILSRIRGLAKHAEGGLVLPFVRTLTRPSVRLFIPRGKRPAKELRDLFYDTVQLTEGHKTLKPEEKEKILQYVPIVKACGDNGSNLFSPVLTSAGRRKLLQKSEYYDELLTAYPQAQEWHRSVIKWARKQPLARARTWIDREDHDKPLPARSVIVLPSGLTVVRGAYSTALLWANTSGDLSRYLLENIAIRKPYLKSRPRKDMLAFRGNVTAHVGFEPSKQVVVYKPVPHGADPVMEPLVLHEFQKILRSAQGLPERFSAETPFGIVIDHTKRKPEVHLLVEPAPEGSSYRRISPEHFEAAASHFRRAGFRWEPKSFNLERNVLSSGINHTFVGANRISHIDKPGFIRHKQEELPWLRDLQRFISEYRRKRIAQVNIGASSGSTEG
ncbi:MAG: hypothetical protein V1708_02675 [Candidatus Micrarchaeota archaeon]